MALAGAPFRRRDLALVLSGFQALGGEDKKGLVRAGGGEMEFYPPGVAEDHRADLQELQADRAGLGPGHLGPLEGQTADRFEQAIGEAGQDQAELVRLPLVTGGAVGEEVELLFLDPVFHLAALAVETVVERLRLALQVGDHITRIGATLLALGGVPSEYYVRT